MPWILFLAFVLLMLVLDLGVFNRTPRAIGLGEALLWTALWVGLAAGFALLLYLHGHRMIGASAPRCLPTAASPPTSSPPTSSS